ncbi:MAG: pyruvate kinase, partial [Thermoflexia bacterium]
HQTGLYTGPASRDPEVIRGLLRAGMDIARINFSHGDLETHARAIATVRRVAQEEGRTVAVLGDLQGPKLRVGELPPEGGPLRAGEEVVLSPTPYAPGRLPVPHPEILADLKEGQRILLDDGQMELRVVRPGRKGVRCRVVVGGRLTSHKGLNLPGAFLRISALTEKDRRDARFAVEQGLDFLALSFIRAARDLLELRELLREWGAPDLPIVAKIEKAEAVEAFEEILEVADAVMVARGDLGVETSPEEVPFYQKHLIRLCNRVGKPVITATQMLQTMIEHPTPTRAEASDVANAVLDGTDAVMLSGETAVGAYPVEAAQTMVRICTSAEAHLRPEVFLHELECPVTSVTEAISRATVEIAAEVGARAILTATMSGTTARMVARYRPPIPILAATPMPRTRMRLTMVWGVTPVLVPP